MEKLFRLIFNLVYDMIKPKGECQMNREQDIINHFKEWYKIDKKLDRIDQLSSISLFTCFISMGYFVGTFEVLPFMFVLLNIGGFCLCVKKYKDLKKERYTIPMEFIDYTSEMMPETESEMVQLLKKSGKEKVEVYEPCIEELETEKIEIMPMSCQKTCERPKVFKKTLTKQK